MYALGGEKLTGDCDILGSNRQARTLFHGIGVIEIGTHRHADAAFCNLQIQRLVQTLPAVFQQRIFAGNAHIRTAVLHVGRHVGGANHQQAHVGQIGVQNEFAGFFRVVQHLNARRLQQRHGFFKNPSFGKR